MIEFPRLQEFYPNSDQLKHRNYIIQSQRKVFQVYQPNTKLLEIHFSSINLGNL